MLTNLLDRKRIGTIKRLVASIVWLASLCGLSLASAQDTSPLWSGLQSGPYGVGADVHYVFDDTRSFFPRDTLESEYLGRPVRILFWYPIPKEAAGDPLDFGDYIYLEPSDSRFTAYNDILVERDLGTAKRQFAGPKADSLSQVLLATATSVHRGATPAQGSFPLILHSLGRNDYQQESTVLWEYLASHGYVVAVVPQFGPDPSRDRLAYAPGDHELQRRDVAFALSRFIGLPYVDASQVGVMGHSSGGDVALLLADENANIDAVVSLDGSITTKDGRDLLGAMPWNPKSIRVPVLNLYAAEKRGLDLSVLDSLTNADRYHVAFNRATHFDFQNWPLYAVMTGVSDPRGESYRSSEHGRDVYVTAVRLTRQFFDAALKGNDRVINYLEADQVPPSIPDGLIQVRYQRRAHR